MERFSVHCLSLLNDIFELQELDRIKVYLDEASFSQNISMDCEIALFKKFMKEKFSKLLSEYLKAEQRSSSEKKTKS